MFVSRSLLLMHFKFICLSHFFCLSHSHLSNFNFNLSSCLLSLSLIFRVSSLCINLDILMFTNHFLVSLTACLPLVSLRYHFLLSLSFLVSLINLDILMSNHFLVSLTAYLPLVSLRYHFLLSHFCQCFKVF